jgi:photosystem II stability/assembly factor-like uncharacterized protein
LKKLFVILFLIFTSLSFSQDYTPWKWSHQSPQGNTLNWVKVWNAATWYMVGLNGTFMKTTNAGATWYFHHKAGVLVATGLGNTTALNGAWFFDMNTGVACGTVTGSQSVTRTTNAGLTWDTAQGLISGPSWNDIFFANNSTGFMAGTTSGRFAKSTNGGISWTIFAALPTLPSSTYNSVCATDPNTIYITSSVASGSNIRVSTDGGATWDPDTAGTGALNKIRFMNASTGVAVGATGNVWVTTNAGTTWVTKPTGNTSAYQDVVFKGSEVIVVGDAFNIYRSTNLGDNWTAQSFLAPVSDQPWTSTYNSLGFAGDTLVIVGGTGLMNRTTNNGANWTIFTQYKKAGTLNDIFVEHGRGRVWAVGAPGSSGSSFDQVMFSTNGGLNWSFQPIPGSTATFNSISMVNSNTGYIGGTTGRVRKTTNGGTSWDSVITGVTFTINNINFADANTGWIFSSVGNASKTTNGGATWSVQTTNITTAINSSDFVNANTGFFVSTVGKVRKTINGGATWDSGLVSNYGSTVNDIVMIDANSGYFAGLTGNVRRTTNGGTSWDTVLTPVSTTLNGIDFVNMQTGFIAGTSGYTARTTNGGSTWTVFNTGGGTINALDVIHSDTAFVVGLTASVHKYAEGTVGGITWSSEIPLQYTLNQNYPNPFNPSTTIRFGLPKAGKVTLKIYDVTGREVAALFNSMELNAGTVTYEFDASRFASGVYFYTLIVNDNKIDTKKMVLVK